MPVAQGQSSQGALNAAPGNSLPVLGDSARGDLSPVLERKLGEEIMFDVRRDRDFLDDAPILEYLNNFGNALAAAYPGARGETGNDFYFFCVRDPMLNAFALPGGFIGVHSALLLAAQNESELASVLSHEIGHVTQRHIARMIGQQKGDALMPLAAIILAALASKAGPDAAIGVFMGGQGLAIQRQIDFTRDAERESDRVGFQIMNAAGFDASGMVAFFQRMQAATKVYSDLTPPWLMSHPLTSERISDIRERIRAMPFRQRIDGLEFYLVRSRARVLQDESNQGRVEAQAAFDSQLKSQNRQQQAAGHYGLAYLAMKRGELAKAAEALARARATMKPASGAVFSTGQSASDGAAMFASLDLEIKLASGQPPALAAQTAKDAALAHDQFPLARGIARQYADALIANGQAEQAASYLREQVRQYREEPKLYDLLAKAYAAQGKLTLQHIALAESYVLAGAVPAAVDQLGIARKAPDASFYDLALIDARERELQTRQRDDKKEKKER
ncbi:M48 family metalloprotease [Massilia sp. DWR3-1-1]|uniref:M48 family metalloprotease n=1 Tax=Massilia sp. DWR3-1-1 TaxID=2804559 RepID=UPI003CFA8165